MFSLNRLLLLPALVVLAGLCAGLAGSSWLHDRAQADTQAAFQRKLERAAGEVTRQFGLPLYGLRGAKGLFMGRDTVSRSAFRQYVNSLNLPVEFPGVRGFGYVEKVTPSDLPAFLARERADGAPGFAMRQLGDTTQPEHFVIRFVEPVALNAAGVGLDLASEAVRRQGLMQAVASGQPTVTGVVSLSQGQGRVGAVLIYLPLFEDTKPPADTGAPLLRGVLYASILVNDLLAQLSDVRSGQLRVELFDDSIGNTSGSAMFDSAAGPATADATPTQPHEPQHATTRVLDLPGRKVTLRATSSASFDAGHQSYTSWLFLAGTLGASLLLAGLLRQQATGRVRAERMAKDMTADLCRLALVAQRSANAVVITDMQRRITWVNEGFERITGYSAAEALGQSPGTLLQDKATHSGTVLKMRAALDAKRGFTGEILNRSKAGQLYWMSLDIQPLHDDAGVLVGFMAIQLDITDRKNAERELRRERLSLQNVIDGTHAGTWEWNVETGQSIYNERWAEIVGWTLAQLDHSGPEAWRRLVHPDDFQRTCLLLDRHFAGLSGTYESEMRLRHKDGHWVWVLSRGKLFSRTADGKPRWMAGTHIDISARKQAEAALRDSQEFLSQTGRIGGVGGWELDLETQRFDWSDETCHLYEVPVGHHPSLAEVLDFFQPAAQQRITDVVQQGVLTGQAFDIEMPIVTALGHHRWVRTVGEPKRVDGVAVRLVGAFQDVTARRLAEDEARRSAELLRGAVEALDDAFVLYGPDDRLVMCNQRHRDIYPESAVMMEPGNSFEEIVRYAAEHGQYADNMRSVDDWVAERVALHRQPHSRLTQRLADGRTLRIVERRMADGHTVGFRVDISELVQATHKAEQASHAAEQASQKAEEASQGASRSLARLQAIYDILPMGLTVTDPQGRIIDCNPASERLLGISKEEHVRRSTDANDWTVLREDGTTMPTEEFPSVRALQLGVAITDSLMQVVTPESAIWLSVSAMPVKHDALGVVIAYADVTEQRQQRQALLAAKVQAEQASRAKSQFLANMSHEIRTPMNAILGMLALLKKTDMSARQTDYAGKTEGAARSLLGLLNDILDFSKVEAGKMLLDPNPFRIDQLMRDLSVIVSANVGTKPVEVLFDIDPALPRRLVGDAMRLQQVLINLSGNAIKFTERGEVVVSVRVLEQGAGSVTLRMAVRDTGIGIAPENQARIFSGFTQAEASTTRRFGGTGLGVAISQRLVALMGGELRLDSALGQGSIFHFTLQLPVAAADGEEQAADGLSRLQSLQLMKLRQPVQPLQPAPPLRALVVDDNPTARDVLRRMAQSLGWAVDAADSGEAALSLLQDQLTRGERYDAVFVDWQMPGLDGWATTRQIREGRLAGDASVVVMVTAHGREMLEQRSSTDQQLLDGFLVKPVTASMLLDAVVDARRSHDLPHPSARGAQPAGARLAGMRLLVVEDNLNNQQVARELLEDEGADVQIAGNGQIAVEAVAAADPPFDVVLMDLQMPVMDGFTATARIRQDLQKTSLPIVAMTANAMASDREACLAAGMNDHVGKPFDLDHLVQVLRRMAGLGSSASPPTMAPAKMDLPQAVAAAAAAAGVKLDSALQRLGGKLPVYERLLRNFVSDLADMQGVLNQCLESQDTESAARLLHTLKGLAATLGVPALADAAGQAERVMSARPAAAERQRVAVDIARAIDDTIAPLTTLQSAIHTALLADPERPSTAESGDAVSSGAAAASMRELIRLLENSDMGATEVMATLQQQWGIGTSGSALRELDDAVSALDFKRALVLGKALLQGCETESKTESKTDKEVEREK